MSYRALAVLLLVAAPAACKKANSAAGGGPGGGGFAMPVEVAAAIRDTVVDAIAATGQLEAIQSIELRPEVSGRITDILVREGQQVADGTPLFKVDDAELKAQVAQAEAERQLARQALERTKQLIAQNASSTSDLEQAEAKSRGADANYDLLKTRLDRTVVRAPFGGVVGRRLVSIGTYVSSQTSLITLQSVNPQHASFDVPERYADRLRRGQLQAGMFIEARLATDVRPNAVVVPEDALLPMEGATFIWVIKGGKADRRQVSVGVRTAGWAEIQGGVEAGDSVVVGGGERLFPTAPVMARLVERRRGVPTAESTAGTTRPAGGTGAAGAAKDTT